MKKVGIALAVLTIGTSVEAHQADNFGKLIGVLGTAMADAKMRRQVASVSQPLVYESALPPVVASDPSDPRNMNLAGLQLGMPVAQARGALQRAGFVVAEESKEYSFAMRVFRDANGKMPQDVRSWGANGRNGQHVVVKFASLPEGAVVDSVEFTMSSEAMPKEAFLAQLGSRYGEADLVEGEELVWCVKSGARCAPDGAWGRQPHLSARPDMRTITLVFADPARDEALEARVNALVDAQKPRVERADF